MLDILGLQSQGKIAPPSAINSHKLLRQWWDSVTTFPFMLFCLVDLAQVLCLVSQVCSCSIVSDKHSNPLPPLALTFLHLFLCSASQGEAVMIGGGTFETTDRTWWFHIHYERKQWDIIASMSLHTGRQGKGLNMGRANTKDFLKRVIWKTFTEEDL